MTDVTPDQIAVAMQRWDDTIAQVARLAQAHSRKVRVLIMLFILDILLTVGVGWNTIQTHDQGANTAHATCVSGNSYRTDDKQRWDYVIGLAQKSVTTPKGEAELANFIALVDKTDKLRKC